MIIVPPTVPQPRTQGLCSWGGKDPGWGWSRGFRVINLKYTMGGVPKERLFSLVNLYIAQIYGVRNLNESIEALNQVKFRMIIHFNRVDGKQRHAEKVVQ